MTLTAMSALFAVAAGGSLSGCAGNRTVFVPEESPIRIGPKADVRVYTMVDGTWTLSEDRIRIPEGWYCVPPSFVAEDK